LSLFKHTYKSFPGSLSHSSLTESDDQSSSLLPLPASF
jgi:hypothetical protein